MYRIIAIVRLLLSSKFHLVTEKRGIIKHMNSSFQSNEYEWMDTSCDQISDMQQQDENIEYVKNQLTVNNTRHKF